MNAPQTRQFQVTFDAHDPRALGEFWCHVLGYQRESPPDQDTWEEQLAAWGVPEEDWNAVNAITDPEGHGPRIFFQQVPESKTVKNRVHLDVRAAPGLEGDARMAALEECCERLVDLGATRVTRVDGDPFGGGGWIVMQDPEGNEFCLD